MVHSLHPNEQKYRYLWRGGWVGPRAGLDATTQRKIPAPNGKRIPVVQAEASDITD